MKVKLSDIDMDLSRNTSRERLGWSPEECESLARNMAVHGQLVPVQVRRLPNGKWKLVFGFRRYTAAVMLGWQEIEAVEAGDGDDGLTNLIENLVRKDLNLWEECVAIREVFPEEMSHDEIAQQLGFSRTWVRTRRRLWELPEHIRLQVQRDELSTTDLMELVKLSPEEQEAKAALLAAAKAEGQTVRERTTCIRKHPRSIKELRRLQSQVHDSGRDDWKALVLFSLGEIDDEELFRRLDFRPTV